MAKSMEELMEIIEKIPNEQAKPGEFILPELMALGIAHEVRNDDIVFAGFSFDAPAQETIQAENANLRGKMRLHMAQHPGGEASHLGFILSMLHWLGR